MNHSEQLIRMALREDIGSGDVTSRVFISPHLMAEGVVTAKAKGILAGVQAMRIVCRCVDRKIKIRWHRKDGQAFQNRQTICYLKGPLRSILQAERVALNFLGHLSGVATLTRQYVQKVRGTKVKIYDTRKTSPLWREWEKEAVRLGGGHHHRRGLWDQGFFKDNHWQAGLTPEQIAKKMKRFKQYRWVIELDRHHLKYLKTILTGRPKVILLDNFQAMALGRAVAHIRKLTNSTQSKPDVEASGGMTLRNIRQMARTGVDRISVGAITHSAPVVDFSLRIKRVAA